MLMAGVIGIRRVQVVLTLALAAAVTVPLLVGTRPAPVEARCYGKYAAKCQAYVGRCHAKCGKKSGAIRACAARLLKQSVKGCVGTMKQFIADCTDSPASCRQEGKQLLASCRKQARGVLKADLNAINKRPNGTPACNKCCNRTSGQAGCLGYFSNSRFYGASRYRGHLSCPYGTPPTTTCIPDGGGGKKPRTRAVCTTTTTTLRPPGSPSGAFVSSVTDRLRGYLASLIPSLTSRWSD
jgi:hypothetical protein